MSAQTYKKKLIEVALPLEEINAACTREKSIRHGHPSTLHLWWARRPLAAARAVIWSSLVDDPSAHPEEFPTPEEQAIERERLFDILRELVVWENSNNQRVLDAAKAEIKKSIGDEPLSLLDPFAGGGAIPLEAQRLGLKAYAQDLNPVAVTINKAMIEIPPKFAGNAPVNPKDRAKTAVSCWEGNTGLAADVAYYGNWMRDEAFRRIGNLYPKVQVPKEQGGGEATAIAWIWARTVKCPNPACGHETILVRSFDLSKKKGKEWHVEPIVENGEIRFEVKPGKAEREGTVNRRGATCVHCGSPIGFDHVRAESRDGKMGDALMAIVAEGKKGRVYVSPSEEQVSAARVKKPQDYPDGKLAYYPGHLNTNVYGLDEFHKLFSNRQLTAMTTFSDLVQDAQRTACEDALAAGLPDDGVGLADGGTGALAYGQAVGVYLAFSVDKLADYNSSICSWINTLGAIRNVFGRQAIPMTWDYAEANPFSGKCGSYESMAGWVKQVLNELPQGLTGSARQFDAQSDSGLRGLAISTDPPYYDNIGYADLSDFFYVWLRRSLRNTYPKLFSYMLVPKAEELVATPYRFDGSKQRAKEFFEDGMFHTFRQVYEYARPDVPVTIYYAFKQSETDRVDDKDKTASSGWETMLSAISRSGFAITGTWPVRSERGVRLISKETNALASSIVLVCRKRPEGAPMCTRRELVSALRRELRPALEKLQQSNIAPVDLAQSAIGPGMGVYSRYAKVLEADGSEMGVRAALQIINEEIDAFFNDQSDNLDRESRFCAELFKQTGFSTIKYGEAEVLANAKNVSIQRCEDLHLLDADKGEVRLLKRDEVTLCADITARPAWALTQVLAHELDVNGIVGAAQLIARNAVTADMAECARALAYSLFVVSDKKGWTQDAYAYNALVTSWADIVREAAEQRRNPIVQESFDL